MTGADKPTTEMPMVRTRAGLAVGVRRGAVTAFHAVPYAAPPVGPLRFAPPQPVPVWQGVRDCTRIGTSPPQNASRLDAVMGIASFEQSEDCLHLDIWTPASDGARRPVMVWLHGGAYMSGGGSQPFYTGSHLAERGDMVVVTVTYRLGALGYLCLPDIEAEGGAPANRGLLDQIAALRWIRDNIQAFGGDPDRVTVAGQSAGGGALFGLLSSPLASGLLHRGIVQSAPSASLDLHQAREIASLFFEKAGLREGDVEALRALDVKSILAAQAAVVMAFAQRPGRLLPWQLVYGLPELPRLPSTAAAEGASLHVPLMLGWTLDEMHAWHAQDARMTGATGLAELKVLPPAIGLPDASLARIEARTAGGLTPWHALSEELTEFVFGSAAKTVADGRAALGGEAWVYRFDWKPAPDARYGACHCIEIPFVFGNIDSWPCAPMLDGADPAEMRAVTRAVQSAWVDFCHGRTPGWPDRRTSSDAMMLFDTSSGPMSSTLVHGG